ncbi:hypothetical protein M2324_004055 [Rhodovulum sulfidophilum]|uniref:hypothetical protein n=1 Tax=Rhodovulum sulfidophilum TaxID=35806 RepID=UPI0005A72F64|nr:hypothetical protein [Rhodovulum sulfidophilum]ANB32627.1 hypothetical protein A6W98_00155 [Rhodovulum sulfidophilum DSM 1374]ANB36477.1 hypothetical protein A6024_00140 [Rhodovulum sulfidophilum]MCW2305623.1 hypothetical protein [Rhodovulum sulfidophilum]
MPDDRPTIRLDTDLDWNRDSIWVADATPLRAIGTEDGTRYVKPSGEQVTLSEDELNARYYRFGDGEILKPHLRPEQAISILGNTDLVLPDGESVRVESCAVIRSEAGDIRIVDRAQYEREYRAVGYRGAERPSTPFSTPPRGRR